MITRLPVFSLLLIFLSAPGLAQNFWQPLPLYGGMAIAFSRSADGTLYAGTQNNGVYRSIDDGRSWEPTGLDQGRVESFYVTPDGDVYAGVTMVGGGIWRSTDNGLTWQNIKPGSGNGGAIVRRSDGTICASSGGPRTLVTSPDGGKTWQDVYVGSVSDRSGPILSLGVNNSGVFYAGSSNGMFKSVDGVFWERVPDIDANRSVTSFGLTANGSLIAGVSGGIYRLQPGQEEWHRVLEFWDYTRITDIATKGNTIMSVNSYGAIFYSEDAGDTWQEAINAQNSISRLEITREGNLLAAVWDSGIYRLDDIDGSWEKSSTGLLANSFSVVHSTSQGAIYAANMTGTIYHSDDEGANWNTPVTLHSPKPIVLQSSPDGEILYASFSEADLDRGQDGVYYSKDKGRTWIPINNGLLDWIIESLRFHPDGRLLAAGNGFFGTGLYSLEDTASTWQNLIQTEMYGFSSLFIDEQGTIVAGTRNGDVMRSVDDGVTWHTSSLIDTLTIIQALTMQEDSIFAATWNDGVYRWNETTQSWQLVSSEIREVTDLLSTPAGALIAATHTGCFQSLDGGNTWTDISSGLVDPKVFSLAITPDGYLLAGAQGGIYKSSANVTDVGEPKDYSDAADILRITDSHYSHGTLQVIFIPASGIRTELDIAVFDSRGARVGQVYRGAASPIAHEFRWHSAHLPAGVYYCRALFQGRSIVTPFVIMR